MFSTQGQIARALNEQFMNYNGHLISSEIDLVTADDVCPKPRWNERTKTCESITIDEITITGEIFHQTMNYSSSKGLMHA